MKKSDFLSILEANLSGYPNNTVETILNKYKNKFKEAEAQGISEDSILNSMGDPYIIAQSYIKNMPLIIKDDSSSSTETYCNMDPSVKTEDLPSVNDVQSFLARFFKGIFSLLGFVFFLIISLPIFFILLSLFICSILLSVFGLVILFSSIFAPSFLSQISSPINLSNLGMLGALNIGIVIFIIGILLIKFNYRLIRALGRKVRGSHNNKKTTTQSSDS